MQHRPAFGQVDRLSREHCIAVRFDAALSGEIDHEVKGCRINEVLRQIGENVRRFDAQLSKATGVAAERFTQVEPASVGFEVAPQRSPGFSLVTTLGFHCSALIMVSRCTASAAN
jgi:hypothetical protein